MSSERGEKLAGLESLRQQVNNKDKNKATNTERKRQIILIAMVLAIRMLLPIDRSIQF